MAISPDLVFYLFVGGCIGAVVLGVVLLGFIFARITDPEAYDYDEETGRAD